MALKAIILPLQQPTAVVHPDCKPLQLPRRAGKFTVHFALRLACSLHQLPAASFTDSNGPLGPALDQRSKPESEQVWRKWPPVVQQGKM